MENNQNIIEIEEALLGLILTNNKIPKAESVSKIICLPIRLSRINSNILQSDFISSHRQWLPVP